MLAGEPYLQDYLKNIREDLKDFKEEVIVPGHVHMWTKTTSEKYFEGDNPLEAQKKKQRKQERQENKDNTEVQKKKDNNFYPTREVDYRGVAKIDF